MKVKETDVEIINDILINHLDPSDRKSDPPSPMHLKTLLNDERSYLFAATDDSAVIGYALAYRFPSLYNSTHLAYLYDIEVSETHRRKGVGSLLIKKILEDLKSDNVTELWLGTGVDNPEGQGLFSATGAIRSEETFNDYTYYIS
ncbi:MAG: GNAT family N-acetyltransferase [Chryseolinea sp.]